MAVLSLALTAPSVVPIDRDNRARGTTTGQWMVCSDRHERHGRRSDRGGRPGPGALRVVSTGTDLVGQEMFCFLPVDIEGRRPVDKVKVLIGMCSADESAAVVEDSRRRGRLRSRADERGDGLHACGGGRRHCVVWVALDDS